MKKIIILGPGGAGKSTLAKRMAKILGIEAIHLDSHFWQPGWIQTPREEWILKQQILLKKKSWIMDGNYGGTIDLRISAADTLIFFDFNRYFCLYRVVKRFFQYRGKTRPDMSDGCNEQLDWGFIKWIWDFPNRNRLQLLKLLAENSTDKDIYIFKRKSDIEKFIKEISS